MSAVKKYITDFNGKTVDIAAMQESYQNYPSYCKKVIGDDGTTGLTNCVMTTHECGCQIEGNGTLQFPLRIKFCNTHS